MTYHLIRIVVIGLFIGLWPTGPATAADVCCDIVDIDQATGIPTAVNRTTGLTFNFTVNNENLVNALRPNMAFSLSTKPGSNIFSITGIEGMNKQDWGNLVDYIDICCTMVGDDQGDRLKPRNKK